MVNKTKLIQGLKNLLHTELKYELQETGAEL